MAKVTVNGKYAGGVWTFYHIDITDFLEPGKNVLKVTVVNNWKNRIIGDLNIPENQRDTWCFVNPYHEEQSTTFRIIWLGKRKK